MVQIDVRGAPGPSKGVPGSISGLKPRKTGPKILIFTPFLPPLFRTGPSGDERKIPLDCVQPVVPILPCASTADPRERAVLDCPPSSPSKNLGGYLRAIWLEIFGPIFPGFLAQADPGTPPDRRGPPRTSICTKNRPRKPILRQFRGAQRVPPDRLQIPGIGFLTLPIR